MSTPTILGKGHITSIGSVKIVTLTVADVAIAPFVFFSFLVPLMVMIICSVMFLSTASVSGTGAIIAALVCSTPMVINLGVPLIDKRRKRRKTYKQCLSLLKDENARKSMLLSLDREKIEEDEPRVLKQLQEEVKTWNSAKKRLSADYDRLTALASTGEAAEEMEPLRLRIEGQIKDCEKLWGMAAERLAGMRRHFNSERARLNAEIESVEVNREIERIRQETALLDDKLLLEQAKTDLPANL